MDSQDLRILSDAYNNVYETIKTGNSQYSTKPGDGKPYKDGPLWDGPNDKPSSAPTSPKRTNPTTTLAPKPRTDVRNRDVRARGGFDPRFDKRPKQTTGTASKPVTPTTTTTSKPVTPTTTTTSKPSGPVSQTPKPSGGGVLGQLDSLARKTAGEIGGKIGEIEGRNRTGNIPVISDIGGAIGRNRGTQKGQQMYDKAKETIGGLLKQDYEFDNFDVILEHLVAEGYADTNQAALAIMANMSEEWKKSILESGYFPTKESQREDEKKYKLSKDRLPGEHNPKKPQKT